jgi:hypothetical protein
MTGRYGPLHDEIQKSWDREEWSICARLCRDELLQTSDSEQEYDLKLKLAYSVLQESETKRVHAEEAVSIYEELLSRVEPMSPRWVSLHRNLGMTFSTSAMHSKTDRDKHLAATAYHYEEALRGIGTDDPPLRASIAAQAGYALMYLKQGDRSKNIIRAKQHLRDALAVFNAADFPEEHEEVSQALESLKG